MFFDFELTFRCHYKSEQPENSEFIYNIIPNFNGYCRVILFHKEKQKKNNYM